MPIQQLRIYVHIITRGVINFGHTLTTNQKCYLLFYHRESYVAKLILCQGITARNPFSTKMFR